MTSIASRPRNDARRGNAIVEFALLVPVLLILCLGALSAGITLDRYMTVQQLARNSAGIFARGFDFAITENKRLALASAGGLGITVDGGDGVVYLSKIVVAPSGSANAGQAVVSEHYVIGDPALASSTIAAPDPGIWPDDTQPLPNGFVRDYIEETSAVATVPTALSSLGSSDTVFIVEVYHKADSLLFASDSIFSPEWLSTRVIF